MQVNNLYNSELKSFSAFQYSILGKNIGTYYDTCLKLDQEGGIKFDMISDISMLDCHWR